MLKVVLIEPEIPQNAGNIARTCACIGAELHMIEPFGFRLSNKYFSRSGCDYWDKVKLFRWACLEQFLKKNGNEELWLFTGRTKKSYSDVKYSENAWLVFGRETAGLPVWFMNKYKNQCVRIPMRENVRSLNLSNSVAIGAYEALRQNKFNLLV